ncbi:MAG TPA: isoprenylcysteine carboxylmethyltransferase family protein [Candidatus Acidoferrum sp.]|nr:isoprenylcysteine carboxylmethyltransferase family protein [Candidatus Acidoferrum sp.]
MIPLRIIGFLILFGAAFYITARHLPSPWTWMQTLGLCLVIPGFVLWLTAHVQLGKSFSLSAQARQLVMHGLYSRIRNPIYLFGSIVIAGFILFSGHPEYLLALIIVIPMQVLRARTESRVLEEKFGEEYRAYRQRTWL